MELLVVPLESLAEFLDDQDEVFDHRQELDVEGGHDELEEGGFGVHEEL